MVSGTDESYAGQQSSLRDFGSSLAPDASVEGAVDLIGMVFDINVRVEKLHWWPVWDTHDRMEAHAQSGWNQAPWPRDQILLFRETLGDRIPENHSIRLFAEILDELDWSSWRRPYALVAGQPPIHPRIMIGSWLERFSTA